MCDYDLPIWCPAIRFYNDVSLNVLTLYVSVSAICLVTIWRTFTNE